jgi:hypothetical protein
MNFIGASISVRETSGNGKGQCSDSNPANWTVITVQVSISELYNEWEASSNLRPQTL